jgi:hypothetical protein
MVSFPTRSNEREKSNIYFYKIFVTGENFASLIFHLMIVRFPFHILCVDRINFVTPTCRLDTPKYFLQAIKRGKDGTHLTLTIVFVMEIASNECVYRFIYDYLSFDSDIREEEKWQEMCVRACLCGIIHHRIDEILQFPSAK